jgi:hypothetical protein
MRFKAVKEAQPLGRATSTKRGGRRRRRRRRRKKSFPGVTKRRKRRRKRRKRRKRKKRKKKRRKRRKRKQSGGRHCLQYCRTTTKMMLWRRSRRFRR